MFLIYLLLSYCCYCYSVAVRVSFAKWRLFRTETITQKRVLPRKDTNIWTSQMEGDYRVVKFPLFIWKDEKSFVSFTIIEYKTQRIKPIDINTMS